MSYKAHFRFRRFLSKWNDLRRIYPDVQHFLSFLWQRRIRWTAGPRFFGPIRTDRHLTPWGDHTVLSRFCIDLWRRYIEISSTSCTLYLYTACVVSSITKVHSLKIVLEHLIRFVVSSFACYVRLEIHVGFFQKAISCYYRRCLPPPQQLLVT